MDKLILLFLFLPLQLLGKNIVYNEQVKTLQVIVNQDWQSPAVMRLGTNDLLEISFDELSHVYHRFNYRIEHCEADWSESKDIFESDWLEGFNNNLIEDYVNSLNTTVLYTHYCFQIPNERCRLKMSGNYRIHIYDEDKDDVEILCAEFRVVEPIMAVGISVSTNTEIDFNKCHQQVSMKVDYKGLNVTNEDNQIWTVVMQNGREDNWKQNVKPNYVKVEGLQWEHNRELIFDAGNEYHKFEVLDVSHPTMGIDHIYWDGDFYHAYPFANVARRSYLYDQDANGSFLIRNSDNIDNERTCDYVYINYRFLSVPKYEADVIIDGNWTTGNPNDYVMTYNDADKCYEACILQKQGYYSYQYLLRDANNITRIFPEEGSFFETENKYQAFVYYKGLLDRTWRLVGYQQISLR